MDKELMGAEPSAGTYVDYQPSQIVAVGKALALWAAAGILYAQAGGGGLGAQLAICVVVALVVGGAYCAYIAANPPQWRLVLTDELIRWGELGRKPKVSLRRREVAGLAIDRVRGGALKLLANDGREWRIPPEYFRDEHQAEAFFGAAGYPIIEAPF